MGIAHTEAHLASCSSYRLDCMASTMVCASRTKEPTGHCCDMVTETTLFSSFFSSKSWPEVPVARSGGWGRQVSNRPTLACYGILLLLAVLTLLRPFEGAIGAHWVPAQLLPPQLTQAVMCGATYLFQGSPSSAACKEAPSPSPGPESWSSA